jgi:hypothetical protein
MAKVTCLSLLVISLLFIQNLCQVVSEKSNDGNLRLDQKPTFVSLQTGVINSRQLVFLNPNIATDAENHVYYQLQINFLSLDTDGGTPLGPSITIKANPASESETTYFIYSGTSWDFEEPSLTIPLSSSFSSYQINIRLASTIRIFSATLSVSSPNRSELLVNHPTMEVFKENAKVFHIRPPASLAQAAILLKPCQGRILRARFGTPVRSTHLSPTDSNQDMYLFPVGSLLGGVDYQLLVEMDDGEAKTEHIIKIGVVLIDQTNQLIKSMNSGITDVNKQSDIFKWSTPKTEAVKSGYVAKLLLSFDSNLESLDFKRKCGMSKHRLVQKFPLAKSLMQKREVIRPFVTAASTDAQNQNYEFSLQTPIVVSGVYVLDLATELKQLVGMAINPQLNQNSSISESDLFLQNKGFYIKEVLFRRWNGPMDITGIDYQLNLRVSNILITPQMLEKNRQLIEAYPKSFQLLTSTETLESVDSTSWPMFLLKWALKILLLVILGLFFYNRCRNRRSIQNFQAALTAPIPESKSIKQQSEMLDYTKVAEQI